MQISKKILPLLLLSFIHTGCFTDVIENEQGIKINAKELQVLTQNLNLSIYPTIKDTTDIPIIAWWGIPEDFTSVKRFEEAVQAGFNLHYTSYSSAADLQKALDSAQVAGIKLLVFCPELLTDTERTVERFMDHPANGGYFLKDEPSVFEITFLKEVINKIEKIDTEHFCYINLYPTYGSDKWGTSTYQEYVQRFATELPLKILSFDHYPIVKKVIRFDWYNNLEIFRNEAKKVNKPFWAFALTLTHYDYPITDINQLRLQVYSNLAYGAKGIQYFTYWSVHGLGTGPIELDGKITDVLNDISIINKEINILSYVFKSSEVLNIFHHGSKIPYGTKSLEALPAYLKKLNIRGGNVLISELENNSNSFLMIQNNNLTNEVGITIEFDPAVNANFFLKDGRILPASLITEEFKLTPGDMVMFMR